MSEIERGIKALEEYKTLEDRFDLIRANIITAWEGTKALEREEREVLYHKLHVLNELKRSFLNDINTGRMAEIAENAERRKSN